MPSESSPSAARPTLGAPVAPRAWAILVVFAAGYWVSYLFRTVNAVIAPELGRDLAVGPAELGFLTSTYFLSFALAQLPVGVALDRLGPRPVVSGLLLVAGAGAVLFAAGGDFGALALGRALIGLGVSACLMGGLKALAVAFPADRQTSVTGFIMAAGALGALSTSLPLEWLLPHAGWRGVTFGVAGVSALVALLVLLAVPPRFAVAATTGGGVAAELAILRGILRAPSFWRYAPQAALYTGGFMALQGLWAGPFLLTVEGRDRPGVAVGLLALNLGMLAGQLAIGFGSAPLERRGLGRGTLMTTSLAVALAIEAVIVLRAGTARGPLLANAPWFLFGAASAASAQVYGVTAGAFPLALSGRVSTAVNQCAFFGAFALQWGLGGLVETLTRRTDAPTAFRIGLGALWLVQALGVAASVRAK